MTDKMTENRETIRADIQIAINFLTGALECNVSKKKWAMVSNASDFINKASNLQNSLIDWLK